MGGGGFQGAQALRQAGGGGLGPAHLADAGGFGLGRPLPKHHGQLQQRLNLGLLLLHGFQKHRRELGVIHGLVAVGAGAHQLRGQRPHFLGAVLHLLAGGQQTAGILTVAIALSASGLHRGRRPAAGLQAAGGSQCIAGGRCYAAEPNRAGKRGRAPHRVEDAGLHEGRTVVVVHRPPFILHVAGGWGHLGVGSWCSGQQQPGGEYE